MEKHKRTKRLHHRQIWQQGKAQAEKWVQQLMDTPNGQRVMNQYVKPAKERLEQWEASWPADMPIQTMRKQFPQWLATQQTMVREQVEKARYRVQHEWIEPRLQQGSQWLEQIWPSHPFTHLTVVKKTTQE